MKAVPVAIAEVKRTRENFLHHHGVPISQEFADFANAIGDLCDAAAAAVDVPVEAQVKRMVERFLMWKLPENFNPDGGISFKKMFNEHTPHPMKHEPTGTNLFDYTQATEMVRYMVEAQGKPDAPKEDVMPARCTWMSFARGGQGYCSCGNLGSQSQMVPYAAWEQHAAQVPDARPVTDEQKRECIRWLTSHLDSITYLTTRACKSEAEEIVTHILNRVSSTGKPTPSEEGK